MWTRQIGNQLVLSRKKFESEQEANWHVRLPTPNTHTHTHTHRRNTVLCVSIEVAGGIAVQRVWNKMCESRSRICELLSLSLLIKKEREL
jgi:hypothetical protein